MKKFSYIDKSFLEENYNILHKSTYVIAQENHCTPASIRRRLIKYDIRLRNCGGSLWPEEFPSEFTSEQIDVIIGSLLGDGWISGMKEEYCRFAKEQKAAFKEYLDWHKILFDKWGMSIVPRKRIMPIRGENGKVINPKTGNKILTGYHFYSRIHPKFNDLRKLWYNEVKILPKDLRLNPLRLAIWFCDDGSRDSNDNRCFLNTQSFTINECQRLINLLSEDLNIDSTMNFNRGKPIIYILAKSRHRLFELISPHIPWHCMRYKLMKVNNE